MRPETGRGCIYSDCFFTYIGDRFFYFLSRTYTTGTNIFYGGSQESKVKNWTFDFGLWTSIAGKI
ncbi:hypothetical protein FDUTEX481_02025 [Tolypothrix sp. PCC 7601]|nr:hypothetical protein FDUTEX481_02025 [Tolypothrix sp. PCC 7601]